MFSSPLRRAISRGMQPGGDLASELRELGDYSVQTKKDAKAICDALAALSFDESSDEDSFSSPLHALVSLFQEVGGREAPAFEILSNEGIPQIIRIFDVLSQRSDRDDADDLLFLLKILAMYGSLEGTEKIVAAAQIPLDPDSYMWHVVFEIFSTNHPHRDYVFRALTDPLPPGFIAIALLDSANGAAIEGELSEHPFDSPSGCEQLRSWLVDDDPDHASYAHSATAALPFINHSARDQLLALAMEHANASVQLEAAWAAGKLGREDGLKILTRFCLDVNHSEVAQHYLDELGHEELIPDEARDESFQAMAAFSSWLAHPNELGRPPDELEIVDHRQLAWPPERELQPFWLIKYRLHDSAGPEDEGDDTDCGLVGSITWCFFSYKMHQRPPEDAYAIHCYWEMEHAGLIEEIEVADESEYASLLSQWQGDSLESPTIELVAEVSPSLNIAARLVALASAKRSGEVGWVVLDGPRSTWYPKAEQPEGTYESVILKIHVGRQLLGFQDPPDRKKYLVASRQATSSPE